MKEKMKNEILRFLRESREQYVSGQQLCEKLEVSRTAVWKNIKKLKEEGYEIEAVSNRGYRLVSCPDILSEWEITHKLDTKYLGRVMEFHEVVDSTNNRAKTVAEQGAAEGTLIVAESQQQGKGRRGRSWSSEKGSEIMMSFVLRPELNPMDASMLTLISALAVVAAIQKETDIQAGIKWPNDIVLNGKKICGILTEMNSELDFIHYVVVGIGVNVNTEGFPEEIAGVATSLYRETGERYSRSSLLARILKEFEERYEVFRKQGNLSCFLEEYNEKLLNLDKEVAVYRTIKKDWNEEDIAMRGVARGITEAGALLVETENGIQEVISGEVSVRGSYGYV